MSTYTYLPDEELKLQHLWSNLIHYSTFGHAIHSEPRPEWYAYPDPVREDVVRVTRHPSYPEPF